jgi:hypothetical protein
LQNRTRKFSVIPACAGMAAEIRFKLIMRQEIGPAAQKESPLFQAGFPVLQP